MYMIVFIRFILHNNPKASLVSYKIAKGRGTEVPTLVCARETLPTHLSGSDHENGGKQNTRRTLYYR